MHWEVEQKFRLSDAAVVLKRLNELDITLSAGVCQADHYFNHPARDFWQTDEAFRLRQQGDDNFVTYKGPKVDPTTKTRRELELPLAPGGDRLAQYRELLESLGFRFVATVRKSRRTGRLSHRSLAFEIAMDEVEGLGSFVELETSADDNGLGEARVALATIGQQLGLTDVERRSYLELLLARSW